MSDSLEKGMQSTEEELWTWVSKEVRFEKREEEAEEIEEETGEEERGEGIEVGEAAISKEEKEEREEEAGEICKEDEEGREWRMNQGWMRASERERRCWGSNRRKPKMREENSGETCEGK